MMPRASRSISLLACLLAAAITSLAGDPLDATLRKRAAAFVEAMNAPGDAALVRFAEGNLATGPSGRERAEAFARSMRGQFGDLGRIEDYRARVLRDGALLFVYCKHAKSGSWQNYQFRVLAEDDHRLRLVFVAIAAEPVEPPEAPIESPEARRWLDARMKTMGEQQPFSGVILVRRAGKDLYSAVEGLADAPGKVPVTRSTRFGMASGSKMFTAVAILQLDQAGKLSLSDPLAKHLPEFPDREFAERVTLHQLLTHTAGAGDYWDDEYEKAWDTITETKQMLPFVLRHLGEKPAGEFAYSNSGYVLLGLVIEAVSGRSYYDYVREHVFEPAGMRSTGYPIRPRLPEPSAIPYEPRIEAGAVEPGSYVPARLNARGTSAGGALATADDLAAFAEALRGGRLLDRKHLDLMTAHHVPYAGKDSWYGYGLVVETSGGVLSYGHGGMAPGTQFELKIYPDSDTVLIVMSNYDTIAPNEMASAIDRIIRGGKGAGSARAGEGL